MSVNSEDYLSISPGVFWSDVEKAAETICHSMRGHTVYWEIVADKDKYWKAGFDVTKMLHNKYYVCKIKYVSYREYKRIMGKADERIRFLGETQGQLTR